MSKKGVFVLKKELKPQVNMQLNFKRDKVRLKEDERMFMFFNCYYCGFHESVIEKHWIKGDMDNFILCIKEIHPHYEKIHSMVGENLKKDGILCTEYYCGKCKSKGDMLPVPAFALDMNGFDVPQAKEEELKTEEPDKKSLLRDLKNLLSKKALKKKKTNKESK